MNYASEFLVHYTVIIDITNQDLSVFLVSCRCIILAFAFPGILRAPSPKRAHIGFLSTVSVKVLNSVLGFLDSDTSTRY